MLSEYHKMDTNEYPNIFGCHIMYQTKYIQMQHIYRTNIRIYSANPLPTRTLTRSKVPERATLSAPLNKRVWFLRETMKFFWMQTIFRVKKRSFFCGKCFSFWMPLQNPILYIGVYRFSKYNDDFSFVYIPVNSQEMPSNTMARAAYASARGIFS